MSKLIQPEFINIISRFENDIDLLRSQCMVAIDDPEGSKNNSDGIDYEQKYKLALQLNQYMAYTFNIAFITYYKFRKKCIEDGYSMQDGFEHLLEAFVDGRIVVKED